MKIRAFTLLELLIGLFVVSILGPLCLQGFNRVQEAAGGARCTARMRTLSQAVLLYTADNNQTFPSAGSSSLGQMRGIWFDYQDLILPYLDRDSSPKIQIFTCESDYEFSPTFPSYAFNGGNEFHPAFKGLAGVRLPSLRQPSRTLLLVEGSMIFSKSWHHPKPGPGGDIRTYASFVDGHARLTTFSPSSSLLNAGVNPPPPYDYLFGE